ncbi:Serine/threonine-protein kinase VRK1 [Halotydeus destructor]|nr:Serine/threonine-protein kinase VRK1 [Halotydeus destructor]
MSKRVKASEASEAASPPKRSRLNAKATPIKDNQAKNMKNVKPKPRIAPNGYRLPDQLPYGEVMTDSLKGQWVIGQTIGSGGFGEIYAAKQISDKTDNWNYVVKVDHKTGPLYAEMNFYLRVAREESIRNWMRDHRLEFLGMPRFIANGIHTRLGSEYRFLIMQRFGSDLQKKLGEVDNKFDVKSTYTIASKVIDILEYIHSFGYIHADIKASNLLLGRFQAPTPRGKGFNEVQGIHTEAWLVDFGLVEKYMSSEGKHKPYEEDQRRANNGTVEFTSRDAHIGALARRSDLEILAYNVLSWLSGGRLPWMSNLKDHTYVYECKCYYMDRLHELFNYAFKKDGGQATAPAVDFKTKKKSNMVMDNSKVTKDLPPGIKEFFVYIVSLDFEQKPDYREMKKILADAVKKVDSDGYDGKFSFTTEPLKNGRGISKAGKKSSVSSPPPMARKVLDLSDLDEPEVAENGKEKKRTLRTRKAPEVKSKAKVSTPKARKLVSNSEPSSLAPNKHAVTDSSVVKSPFNNPTPAMLELMQRLKEKQQLKKGTNSKLSVAQKLINSAAATANKSKLKPVTKNHEVHEDVLLSSASDEEEESPVVKRKPGRPKGSRSRERPVVKRPVVKLSSTSSTNSTKENKFVAPPRRSPRASRK